MGTIVETFLFTLDSTAVSGEFALYRNGEIVMGLDEDDINELVSLFDAFQQEMWLEEGYDEEER